MIKLQGIVNNILNEYRQPQDGKSRSIPVNIDYLIKALETDYSIALNNFNNNIRIYRNYKSSYSAKRNDIAYYIDPKNEERTSKDTSNFYTKLISDVLPSWREYPKRNRSVIASTSPASIGAYGSISFLIFPKNGAKIAVCSSSDCWTAFRHASQRIGGDKFEPVSGQTSIMSAAFTIIFLRLNKKELSEENYFDLEPIVRRQMDEAADKFIQLLQQNIHEIKDIVNHVDDATKKIFNKYKEPAGMYNFVDDLRVNLKDSFMDYFDNLYNPKTNEIFLTSVDNPRRMKGEDSEIWTDSECVMLSRNVFGKNDNTTDLLTFLKKWKEDKKPEQGVEAPLNVGKIPVA